MIETNILGKSISSAADKILLTNQSGGFFFFSFQDFSKYQGLFFNTNLKLFKTLESIKLKGNPKLKKIIYSTQSFEIINENCKERYTFPKEESALIYETDSKLPLVISLEAREMYDSSFWGRYYSVCVEDGVILITYKKKMDEREKSNAEYTLYTAIASQNLNFNKLDSWKDTTYPFDASRNDSSVRAVYNAIEIKSNKLSISSSIDKEQAIKCAKESFSYRPRENNNRIQLNSNIKDIKVQYANYLSAQALRSLMLTNSSQRGIYAGLPWFTQFWTRDSAISCGALDIIGESSFVLELLNKYLSAIRPDGLIPNRLPNSELDSIDSVGLVFLRVSQMIEQFSDVQLSEIKNKLLQAIKSILVYHSNNDLIIAKPQETWMDTIQRTGARIEIQALQLNMYELLRKLSVKFKDKAAEEFAFNYKEKLTNTVRDEFFKDGQLYDGVEDNTPRPNVFLAYYFYPKMFTDKEWESIFDFALEALWLNWGGLATISTGSSQFTDKHTGVNNKSYHNGDSWFFVNNITALVLRRLNKNKYSKYIDKILSASTHEIIDLGVFGFHAEISSASQLESNGCIAQAWSSATYIELTKELFG